MFDSDRPILSSLQDKLGRATFAKYLARCMLDHTHPESLVIGLYGAPGSGKTSLINLVLEELRYAGSNMFDDEKPIILNFSPWSYSGQGQLVYGFYRRLSSELRRAESLSNAKRIVELLELYASFFTQQPLPKGILAKKGLHLKSKMENNAWELGQDPTIVKAELNDLLRNQKHKIIIMIDNISRLENKEINQILQVVKSMGDYANTIYLLSLDKHQVTQAINQIHPDTGEEYLEKLVQLPFDVPPISSQDLENILFDRLIPIIQKVPEDTWDASYWADLYYSTLKYFFQSCRDITRYTNTLGFSYLRVKDVVNPVDFFALTAIEVFEPQVYFGIRENKDLFTDLLDNVYALDHEKWSKDQSRSDEILKRAITLSSKDLKILLMFLFPRLASIYEPNKTHLHSESLARKNRRLCSPDMFEVYFRLSIPTGFIPESEMNTILALASDPDSFDQALTRLNQDERVTKFLDLLDSTAIHKIPKKNIPNVLNALLDCADLFPFGESSPISFNTPMRIHRLCHQLLQEYETTQDRFIILQEAINKANKSLYILVHEITEQALLHQADTYHSSPQYDLTSDQLFQLQNHVLDKIHYWAENARLVEHPKLLNILYAWKNWGREEDAEAYVNKIIQTEKGLLAFLSAALKPAIDEAITRLEKNPDWENNLNHVKAFTLIETIEPFAKAIFENDNFEKLREREQLAILIFLDLIHAKTKKVIPKTTI